MSDNVTQGDRDAYANEVEKFGDKEYADLIRAGQRDTLSMLQAFAAHRSTAQPEVKALAEALETAIGLLWEHCEGIAPRIEPLEQALAAHNKAQS